MVCTSHSPDQRRYVSSLRWLGLLMIPLFTCGILGCGLGEPLLDADADGSGGTTAVSVSSGSATGSTVGGGATSLPQASLAHRRDAHDKGKKILQALHQYHDTHIHFPPAYVAGEDGKPMHSWRVLLLPHLGERALFDQYDMNQPWDSPANLEVAKRIPAVYQNGGIKSDGPYPVTPFQAISGKGTILAEDQTSRFADIKNGVGNTAAFMVNFATPVVWTAPEDISPEAVLLSSQNQLRPESKDHLLLGLIDGRMFVIEERDVQTLLPTYLYRE